MEGGLLPRQAAVRFAEFTHEQAAVVVAYLRWKAAREAFLRNDIDEALRNYWLPRSDAG